MKSLLLISLLWFNHNTMNLPTAFTENMTKSENTYCEEMTSSIEPEYANRCVWTYCYYKKGRKVTIYRVEYMKWTCAISHMGEGWREYHSDSKGDVTNKYNSSWNFFRNQGVTVIDGGYIGTDDCTCN